MSDLVTKALKTRDRLNAVSPSFCLAKWKQVTIHLHTGQTHSCHHPTPHQIPLEEIAADPTALHNTLFKKQQREAMLKGQRPAECDYCWNIEDANAGAVSDRYLKSQTEWAEPSFNEVRDSDPKASCNPSSVEVSFSNACNFKCAYCAMDASSKWQEEVRKFGGYLKNWPKNIFNDVDYYKSVGRFPELDEDSNPYIKAFWKWWPDLYGDLVDFRITGGEPLLSKHTFQIMDFVCENPRKDLQISINSNLGVPFGLIEKFADKVELISQVMKKPRIYTSLDTWGHQAEYIRYGMDFDKFIKNVRYILTRLPDIDVIFMCTFNALSLPHYQEMLEGILALKREFNSPAPHAPSRITLDISYLRHPDMFCVKVLPPDFIPQMNRLIEFMDSHATETGPTNSGYYAYEREKLRRVLDWMKVPVDPKWLSTRRAMFFDYFSEYDRRRDVDFKKTFPELGGFWELCERESDGFRKASMQV